LRVLVCIPLLVICSYPYGISDHSLIDRPHLRPDYIV
jgi:hypothetical protein